MRTKLLIVTLVVVAAAGLLAFQARDRLAVTLGFDPPATGQAQATRPASRAPVEVAAVTSGEISETTETIGALAANETVTIAPEIPGRITALNFVEGAEVEKDQVLVELDSAILEGELKQAEADLSLAEDAYERASQLAKRGAGTVVALEQATAQRLAVRVKVDLARTRLDKTKIRTPFAGYVGLRTISVGNFVNAGQGIVTVTSVDPIKVDFRVPELFLSNLHDGQQVDVVVDAFPDRVFKGTVYAIDPIVDVNGRAVRLRARVENKDRSLAPGLFARVTLTIGRKPGAILMPEAALVPHEGGGVVFTVEDGVAQRREVKLGKRLDGKVEVLDGLTVGELVVTAGQARLRDAAPVEVQDRQVSAQVNIDAKLKMDAKAKADR